MELIHDQFFILKGKDNQEYRLPVNITNTRDIFNYIRSVLSYDEHFIFYNNCYLSTKMHYNLLEIGYSPEDVLQMEHSDNKSVCFHIPLLNYQYDFIINQSTTVFDMKKIFAEQFFSVPQVIILKINNTILSDEELLFNVIDNENSTVDVTVDEDYILVRACFDRFYFVCLHADSTIGNLKDTLSIYSQKGDSITSQLKYNPNLLEDDISDESPLKTFSERVSIFEFTQNSTELSSFPVTVDIFDEGKKHQIHKIYNFPSDPKLCVYTIMCQLEKVLRIERSLFIPQTEEGEIIDHNELVSQGHNDKLFFLISKKVQTKINNEPRSISYLATIKNVQSVFKFEEHNFAIIINNHFAATNEKSSNLLVNFMNDTNEIHIIKSNKPCHLKTIFKINEKNEIENKKKFIIPDSMPQEEISRIYLHTNPNSIAFKTTTTGELAYSDLNERKITFYMYDKPNLRYEDKVTVKGKNPRVIDLVQKIFKKKKKPGEKLIDFFQNTKYEVVMVNFKNEILPFYESLSNIFDDEKNRIKIRGSEKQKNISILNLINNDCGLIPLDKYNENWTAQKIIEKVCKDLKIEIKPTDLRLYLDFNELAPEDSPLLLKSEYNLLILNTAVQTKKITITNGTSLKVDQEVTKSHFDLLSYIISGMFLMMKNEMKYSVKVKDHIYKLPMKFDAGSLPENAVVLIDYKYKYNEFKEFKLKFRYESTKTLRIENIEQNVESFIPMIQREFNLMNVSKTALMLKFYNFEIQMNQSFASLKIPANSIITVCPRTSSIIPVKIAAIENPDKQFEFLFNIGDKIIDVKNHFKTLSSEDVNFSLNGDGSDILDDNADLEKEMKLFLLCKKVNIICDNSPKGIKVSEILTVSEAVEYLNKLNESEFYLFVKNAENDGYDPVDPKTRLYEIKDQLYAHHYFSEIGFTNYSIFQKREFISEQSSVKWLKDVFISKALLIDSDQIMIMKDDSNKQISNKVKLGRIVNDEFYLRIELGSNEVETEDIIEKVKDETDSKVKKEEKTTKVEKEDSKAKKEERDDKATKVVKEDDKAKKDDKVKKVEKEEDKVKKDDDKAKKVDDKVKKVEKVEDKAKKDDKVKKVEKEEDKVKKDDDKAKKVDDKVKKVEKVEDKAKKDDKVKKVEKDDDKAKKVDDKVKKVDDKVKKVEKVEDKAKKVEKEDGKAKKEEKTTKVEKEEDKAKKDDKVKKVEKEDDKAKKNIKPNKKLLNKNKFKPRVVPCVNSLDQLPVLKVNKPNDAAITAEERKDDIIEEEEELEDETINGNTFSFQINKKAIEKFSFEENATIEDAKIKIAKTKSNTDPNCISISFDGKTLRKETVISSLNLGKKDVFHVTIISIEDLFLRTAKSIKVYGQADIEEYDYSDNDE